MTERDLDTKPYTTDEQRVCEFLTRLSPDIGCGDDPIGFLMASYEWLLAERKGKIQ